MLGIRARPVIFFWAWACATAQTPALDAFRELRRRLDEGRETASLVASLRRYPLNPSGGVAASYRIRSTETSTNVRGSSALDAVRAAACRSGIPPDLALALVDRESRFHNDVTGIHGELGAAQILPATANAYGFDIGRLSTDFAYNVESGMRILRDLSERFGGDWKAVLRAYNGGPGFASAAQEAQVQTARYASEIETWRSQYGPHCP
jgi:soluble lytic murein transglycosylase-like protein